MGRGRQAWCPRCDEVRAGRAGAPCPACDTPLVDLGPEPRRAAARSLADLQRLAGERARALLPAARAAAGLLLTVAVLAGAFLAGRLTGGQGAGTAAAPTTSSRGDPSDRGWFASLGWEDTQGGVTLTLTEASTSFRESELVFEVDGLPEGWMVGELRDVTVHARDGRVLVGPVAQLPVTDGSASMLEVDVPRLEVSEDELGAVDVGGLTLGRVEEERIQGELADPRIPRFRGGRLDGPCRGCQLTLEPCDDCLLQPLVAEYRGDQGLIALAPSRPLDPNRYVVYALLSLATPGFGGRRLEAGLSLDQKRSAPSGIVQLSFTFDTLLSQGVLLESERVPLEVLLNVVELDRRDGPWRLAP